MREADAVRSPERSADRLPEWAVLHVPHSSTLIPSEVREQFALTDEELAAEVVHMTDHDTDRLFGPLVSADRIVRSPISRLVVDVERFADDAAECMAARGMGAIYVVTCDGRPLRRSLNADERTGLIQQWYVPHHRHLTACVASSLAEHGKALLLDCHSFPRHPLPYELDQRPDRPEICIGTDAFHTSPRLSAAFVREFRAAGFTVDLDRPFSGALVPLAFYQRDHRVRALMVEVRRDLYCDETTGAWLGRASALAQTLRQCIIRASGTLASAEDCT